MGAAKPKPAEPAAATATLGDVLYRDSSHPHPSERDWVSLVQSVAARNQQALEALYDRAHRPVFTLIIRITGSRETAEEVTLDVFHDVWRRASQYDPANGTALGWIMNQARSRAIDRVRFDERQKRSAARPVDLAVMSRAPQAHDVIDGQERGRALRTALAQLAAAERQVIEEAFFGEQSHSEVAQALNAPLGTVKTRIRSGLLKLRQALATGEQP
jgi:RNA polymerase sigma-70 factor, ECF subfamily